MSCSRSFFVLLISAVLLFGSQKGQAATLLLDFGNQAVTNTSPDFDATVSAARAAGALTSSETQFNQIGNSGTSNVVGGLLYGDATPATGVTLTFGLESTYGNNTITYGTTTDTFNFTSVAANTVNTGVFSGTRVGKDAVFAGRGSPNNTVNAALGLRIDGLSVGEYQVYFVGKNTNSTAVNSQRFYLSTGATATSFSFLSGTSTTDVLNDTANTNPAYLAGRNYNVLSFSITSPGQSLFFATEGITSVDGRGFLNSLEIVQVPEPASAGLAIAGGMVFLVRRRRA
jgi:hypothetical protein